MFIAFVNLKLIRDFRPNVNGKTPKLFFVSSSSTTSTVSTTTLCYTSINNAAVVACGRKKRAIMDEVLGTAHRASQEVIKAEASHEELVSGMDEATAER